MTSIALCRAVNDGPISFGLKLLPAKMDTPQARVMLLAIAMQESRLIHRRQLGDGPARGLWQFEPGTRSSRGGVWGVFLHPASADLLRRLCVDRGVQPSPADIYRAIETDDILAAGLARLLLWTDALPLPAVTDVDGAWRMYALRTWRPSKPHPSTWPGFHLLAGQALGLR